MSREEWSSQCLHSQSNVSLCWLLDGNTWVWIQQQQHWDVWAQSQHRGQTEVNQHSHSQRERFLKKVKDEMLLTTFCWILNKIYKLNSSHTHETHDLCFIRHRQHLEAHEFISCHGMFLTEMHFGEAVCFFCTDDSSRRVLFWSRELLRKWLKRTFTAGTRTLT